MSSVNVGEPFKFSTVSLESFEAISFLKEFFHLQGPVMLKICNKSFEQRIYPDNLKNAKIISIFKEGDRKKQNNCRPVSIPCSSGKILENNCRLPIKNLLE